MDIAVHWGILRQLRQEIHAKLLILVMAIMLDILVLGGFLLVKVTFDPLVVIVAIVSMAIIATVEIVLLRKHGFKNSFGQAK